MSQFHHSKEVVSVCGAAAAPRIAERWAVIWTDRQGPARCRGAVATVDLPGIACSSDYGQCSALREVPSAQQQLGTTLYCFEGNTLFRNAAAADFIPFFAGNLVNWSRDPPQAKNPRRISKFILKLQQRLTRDYRGDGEPAEGGHSN